MHLFLNLQDRYLFPSEHFTYKFIITKQNLYIKKTRPNSKVDLKRGKSIEPDKTKQFITSNKGKNGINNNISKLTQVLEDSVG